MITWPCVVVVLLTIGHVRATRLIPENWPNREHRGVWIATVDNIDWPLSANNTVSSQQNQLKRLIGQIRRARLNAVYFQVRPTGDALYNSRIEPWSRYLTGQEGRPPSPLWDPLQYIINICRPLGIEVHAWINPYRANLSPTTDNIAPNHMALIYPQYAYVYSTYIWMDPGAEEVQNRTAQVALDLVNRYDLAGLHMDDYFYPYPVDGWTFPDDHTYAMYLSNGGTLAKDDWRRDNVNSLVRRLHTEIHIAKPWVKFSVSPFGLYRPGHPEGMPPPIAGSLWAHKIPHLHLKYWQLFELTLNFPPLQNKICGFWWYFIGSGFDQFSQIYCDPLLWMQQGWVDMLQPQLYWRIDPPAQSYPVLLDWWITDTQNPKVIPLMAGNYLSRIDIDDWPLDEIKRQVDISREPQNRIRGSYGNVMFSARMFRDNINGTVNFFANYIYTQPTLQPEYKLLAANLTSIPIVAPEVQFISSGRLYVSYEETTESPLINQIAIYKLRDAEWILFKIFPIEGSLTKKNVGLEIEDGYYAATLIDRFGREGLKKCFSI